MWLFNKVGVQSTTEHDDEEIMEILDNGFCEEKENALVSLLLQNKSLKISEDSSNPNLTLLIFNSPPNPLNFSFIFFFRLLVSKKNLNCRIPENIPYFFPNLYYLFVFSIPHVIQHLELMCC